MLLCYNPCQTYFWFLLLLLQVKLSISSSYYDLRLLTFSPLRSWHHHGMENKITNKWVETAVVAVYICITCILQYCCHSNFKKLSHLVSFKKLCYFYYLWHPFNPPNEFPPYIPIYLTNDLFQLLVSFLFLHFIFTYSAKERNEKISRTIYLKKIIRKIE